MAEQFNNEGSSSKHIVSGESSDSNVELNVKTLDSQIYHFVVDKNMPVSAFKEKIANEIGLAAGQQRLIFRGKVLKDEHRLSEYHVESGHTLHLVERQQPQSQQPADSGSGEPNSNSASQGTDANAPRSRVGQISHSVVLGTYNVGDQGEGGGALDISRVIGSVLNSIGLGNLTQPNGSVNIQTPVSLNVTGQGPLGNEAERARSNAAVQNQSGSQPSTGPSPPMPHVLQIPLGGTAIPLPSLLSPIPDSLQTLMDFMNRMEQFLARNGYQPNTTRTSSAQLPAITNARGLPTLEALTIVLRGAERLLSSQIIASLSHLAGSLERDGASHDISVRGQIHAEAAQLGITMQHLGALFLELGRTVLTLRMGQSPGESFVHSGPAVYISPSGPNPIMVQPFPHQTTSLFGTSVPPTNPIPFSTVGVGNPPRHLNIHIHAGGSVTPMAPGGWVNGGDGLHGERENANGSNDSTAARNLGNVFSGAMPPHSIGISASGAPQTSTVSGSQSNPLSSLVDQINSHIRRSLAGEVPEETQIPPGQTATSVANSSVGSTTSTSEQTGDQIEEPLLFSTESRASRHQSEHKPETEGINAPKVEDLKGSEASTDTLTGLPGSSSSSSEDALKAEAGPSTVESRDVPIGLGLGGLERKKRGKQPKIQTKGEETGPATTLPDKADASTTSGQILQSLLSRGSNVQPTGTGSSPSSGQQFTTFPSSGGQVPDVGGIMSQVLQSPILNGLLSGVSEQTGAGSPDVLRNMLQQVTQNPAMMNVVGQIAQQINPQDLGGMFGAMGGQGSDGRGGGIDLSSMMQQMMPIVSQALGGGGGGSSRNQPFAGLVQDLQRQASDGFTNRDERGNSHIDQVGLQGVVRHIENLDPPQDVFRSMAENAAQLHANGTASHDILSALCSDEDLANEYAEILRRDLSKHHAHEE